MVTSQPVKRVSITIEKTLLDNLDEYVTLQKTIDEKASRSGEICKLVAKFIPVESP